MKKIIICDRNAELIEFATIIFRNHPNVEVMPIGTDIFDIVADAIVSPANSYGYYGGGFDGILASKLPQKVLENTVRIEIANKYPEKILPIGRVLTVNIQICNYKYLIVAPTMSQPGLNISGTRIPFDVMKAICTELVQNTEINSVVVMGLGTGVGGISPRDCIRQMFEAVCCTMRKKMYKVLNPDMKSPFQGFETEVGVEYHCPDFDDSDDECSRGFYATEPEGLVYSYRRGKRVFEVEVWGENKRFNRYKWRFENQKLIREVPEAELREILKKESEKVGYNVLEMCFPINPFIDIKRESDMVSEEEIELLKKWSTVRNYVRHSIKISIRESVRDSINTSLEYSVWESVRESVNDSGDSIWISVGDSVGDSVLSSSSLWSFCWDSVRDSIWAYISSLFPNVEKWEGVEHPEGENPFQPCVDLWRRGLVPSFDGKTWRLHAGEYTKVVYEWTPEKS